MHPLDTKFGNSTFHSYADDTQVYLQLMIDHSFSLKLLLDCLNEVKAGMASHFLNYTDDKTKVIIFGPSKKCSASTDQSSLE